MIFVFAEDATLHVVDDLEAVRRLCEPIDVESGVFTFFDENGRPLAATFTKPNRERRILGLLSSVEPGEYVLGPGGSDLDPISVALQETASVEHNRWFQDLAQLRKYLSERGVV